MLLGQLHLFHFCLHSQLMLSKPAQNVLLGSCNSTIPSRQSTRSAGSSPKSLSKAWGVHSSLFRYRSTPVTTTTWPRLHLSYKQGRGKIVSNSIILYDIKSLYKQGWSIVKYYYYVATLVIAKTIIDRYTWNLINFDWKPMVSDKWLLYLECNAPCNTCVHV